jgi:acyl-coenzyme A thioesterase PaaI-like protein
VTSSALFTQEGESTWRPTDAARGPWAPDALHGGPVAALLAHASSDHLDDLQPVRLTVEILRPVPLDLVTVATEVVRPGRRVRAVDATMTAGGTAVAKATLVGIRRAPVPAPEQARPPVPPGPQHGALPDFTGAVSYEAFHNTGVEHRFVRGAFEVPGPATDWIRLTMPVVDGLEIRPIERVVAAADFGNGISRIIDFAELLFINPDLTVYMHREPVGEWVCLDSVSYIESHGIGMAKSDLFDIDGPIGAAAQSLVIDHRS